MFNNGYKENWSKEIFAINSVLKTNALTNKIKDLNGDKIKDLNGETIIGFFNEKSICWVKNGVSVLRTVF